jgi:hypothetical protein
VRTKKELLVNVIIKVIVKVIVKAYADDVTFISESEDGITQMLQILDQFVEWSRIEINVSKCATASYIYDENKQQTYLDDSFQFRGETIPDLTIAESIRYLDAPIAARRIVKLKSAKFKLNEMEVLLGKIMSSTLLTVQKIDAVKTFRLPSTDFPLLNKEVR